MGAIFSGFHKAKRRIRFLRPTHLCPCHTLVRSVFCVYLVMNLEMLSTCVLGSTQGLLSLHSFPFPVLYLVCFNIPQLFSSWVDPTRTRWSVLSACVREKSFPEPSDVADLVRGPLPEPELVFLPRPSRLPLLHSHSRVSVGWLFSLSWLLVFSSSVVLVSSVLF